MRIDLGNMRLGRTRLIVLLTAAAAGTAATFALWPSRPVDPTVPAVLRGKDPLLRERVEQTLRAVSADPRNPQLWIRLGYVYEAHLLTSLALDSYLQALALDENRPRAWYRVAKIRMTMGDRAGALEAAGRVAAAAPDFAPVRWRLGLWQLEEGHLKQAQASFESAIALDPEDPAGWWGLARVLLQKQQPAKAAELLESMVKKWPRDSYAQLLLGTAYRQLGRWREAGVALERGAGSAPPWPSDDWDKEVIRYKTGLDVEFEKARRFFASGRINAALGVLEKLRRLYPQDRAVLQNLGMLYSSRKRFRQALEVYQEMLRSSPGDVQLHLNAASAYTGLRNSNAALEHLDRAISLDGELGEAYAKKGTLLADLGRYPAAADALELALRRDPHNPRVLLQLGLVRCSMEQWEAGLANLQAATELDSTYYQAFMSLGEARKRLGELDEAEAAFKRAAALNPELEGLLHDVQRLKAQRRDP